MVCILFDIRFYMRGFMYLWCLCLVVWVYFGIWRGWLNCLLCINGVMVNCGFVIWLKWKKKFFIGDVWRLFVICLLLENWFNWSRFFNMGGEFICKWSFMDGVGLYVFFLMGILSIESVFIDLRIGVMIDWFFFFEVFKKNLVRIGSEFVRNGSCLLLRWIMDMMWSVWLFSIGRLFYFLW